MIRITFPPNLTSDIYPKSGDSSERLQAGFIRCSDFLSVIPHHEILGSYSQVSKFQIKNLQTCHTPKKTDPNKPVFLVGFFIASPYQSPALVPSAPASRQTFLPTHALMHRNRWQHCTSQYAKHISKNPAFSITRLVCNK